MADVTLAECNEQIWVVGGEEYLDALLINDLPEGVTVELLRCEGRAELFETWRKLSPDSEEDAQPWVLNPALTRRLLRQLGLRGGKLQFTPWSAMLDADAQDEIAAAAAWLTTNPDGQLLLRQFSAAKPAPGQEDLQRLRAQLVTGALARAGAEPTRIRDEIVGAAGDAKSVEQMQIVMEPSLRNTV